MTKSLYTSTCRCSFLLTNFCELVVAHHKVGDHELAIRRTGDLDLDVLPHTVSHLLFLKKSK